MRKTGSVFLSSGKGMPQSHIQALFVCADFRFFVAQIFFCAAFGTVAGDYQMEELETDLENMYKTTYGKSPLKITKE